MATTYYHTLDGQIYGETTSGVRTNYLSDALGSVTATVNSSSVVVNRYRYKPYGSILAKVGAGADPRFLWTGETNSSATNRAYAEQYNIHRHYGTTAGRWTSVDPLWPDEQAYVYVCNNPTTSIDPSGLGGDPILKNNCTNDFEKLVATCHHINLKTKKEIWRKYGCCSGSNWCITCDKVGPLLCYVRFTVESIYTGTGKSLQGQVIKRDQTVQCKHPGDWVLETLWNKIANKFLSEVQDFLTTLTASWGLSNTYTDCSVNWEYIYKFFLAEGCKDMKPWNNCTGSPYGDCRKFGGGGGGSW